jgi:hypothetical protein
MREGRETFPIRLDPFEFGFELARMLERTLGDGRLPTSRHRVGNGALRGRFLNRWTEGEQKS